MLLSEMESTKHVTNTGGMFRKLLKMWKDQVKDGRPVTTLGRIGPYRIVSTEVYGYGFGSEIIALRDTHDDQFALFAQFGKKEFPNKKLLEEDRLGARLDLHGANLPIKLYSWLLRKGYSIMSSYAHSPGGRSVWERLVKTPGIVVIGHDLLNKKSFQVDTDNLQNEYLWTDDIKDELRLFRQNMAGNKNLSAMKKKLASLESALVWGGRMRLVASAGGK